MHSTHRLLLIVIATFGSLSLFPHTAKADEEGRLPIAHIQLDSPGLDNSGPIHIDVFQDTTGISKLKVSAFGKLCTATKTQLAAINGDVFNIVGASYSRGYLNTGGRSIYVLLYQGFSSGAQVSAVVTVTERGDVRVKVGRRNTQ